LSTFNVPHLSLLCATKPNEVDQNVYPQSKLNSSEIRKGEREGETKNVTTTVEARRKRKRRIRGWGIVKRKANLSTRSSGEREIKKAEERKRQDV